MIRQAALLVCFNEEFIYIPAQLCVYCTSARAKTCSASSQLSRGGDRQANQTQPLSIHSLLRKYWTGDACRGTRPPPPVTRDNWRTPCSCNSNSDFITRSLLLNCDGEHTHVCCTVENNAGLIHSNEERKIICQNWLVSDKLSFDDRMIIDKCDN